MVFLTGQEQRALQNRVLTFIDDGAPFSRDRKYVDEKDKGRDHATLSRLHELSNNETFSKTSHCAWCDSQKTTLIGIDVQKTSEEYVNFTVKCYGCGKEDLITVKWSSIHYYMMLY